jgi:hypothetical protein
MTYEQLPDEWKAWLDLAPLERLAQSERLLVEYLAIGGSLDPDPDPTSPFDIHRSSRRRWPGATRCTFAVAHREWTGCESTS